MRVCCSVFPYTERASDAQMLAMLQYPEIDPVAVSLGPLTIHWYGVTYLVAFLAGWWLAKHRAAKPNSGWNPDEIGDLVFYIVLGVIVGGKLGSIVFYQWDSFLQNPLHTLNPMNAGMSFHGGFIGVLLAFYLYARNTKRTFFEVSDFIAPAFPIGLGAGRIGKLYQRRALGPGNRCALGNGFSPCGSRAASPESAIPIFLAKA